MSQTTKPGHSHALVLHSYLDRIFYLSQAAPERCSLGTRASHSANQRSLVVDSSGIVRLPGKVASIIIGVASEFTSEGSNCGEPPIPG